MYGVFEEGCGVVVLQGAIRALMLERELVVLEVAHIVRVEGARLLIRGLLKFLQCLKGFESDARKTKSARGVLCP